MSTQTCFRSPSPSCSTGWCLGQADRFSSKFCSVNSLWPTFCHCEYSEGSLPLTKIYTWHQSCYRTLSWKEKRLGEVNKWSWVILTIRPPVYTQLRHVWPGGCGLPQGHRGLQDKPLRRLCRKVITSQSAALSSESDWVIFLYRLTDSSSWWVKISLAREHLYVKGWCPSKVLG